jgi:hypothetical protein
MNHPESGLFVRVMIAFSASSAGRRRWTGIPVYIVHPLRAARVALPTNLVHEELGELAAALEHRPRGGGDHLGVVDLVGASGAKGRQQQAMAMAVRSDRGILGIFAGSSPRPPRKPSRPRNPSPRRWTGCRS